MSRHQCTHLLNLLTSEFLSYQGDQKWLLGLDEAPEKLRRLDEVNRLLAHRPWLLEPTHILVGRCVLVRAIVAGVFGSANQFNVLVSFSSSSSGIVESWNPRRCSHNYRRHHHHHHHHHRRRRRRHHRHHHHHHHHHHRCYSNACLEMSTADK